MKYVIVDYRITKEEENAFKNLGFNLLKTPKCTHLYEAIDGHPDIQLHLIDNYNIVVQRDMDYRFVETLKNLSFNIYYSKNSLSQTYPKDIILNGASFGKYFIHNLKYTDETLLNFKEHKLKINVSQGYTKCSTAIVSDTSIITSDNSIKSALKNTNINILHIPYGDIVLEGMNYGFIGGCCGLLSRKVLGFFGELEYYPHGDSIKSFLTDNGVDYVALKSGKLFDRGSIFIFER